MKYTRSIVLCTCACLWLAGVGAGIRELWNYESFPGSGGRTPRIWPDETLLHLGSQGTTLVMALHPRCPCSRATLGELAELMAANRGSLNAYVLYYQPKDADRDWAKTDLWTKARAIRGVTPVIDVGGRETRRFGGATSGHTSLYDAQGRLLFTGGITLARGHAGNNPGRTAVASWASRHGSTVAETPVFGCSIFEEPSGINSVHTFR